MAIDTKEEERLREEKLRKEKEAAEAEARAATARRISAERSVLMPGRIRRIRTSWRALQEKTRAKQVIKVVKEKRRGINFIFLIFVILLIVLGFYWYQTGQLQEMANRGYVFVSNKIAPGAQWSFFNIAETITDITKWRNPTAVPAKKEERIGIIISNLRGLPSDTFREDQKIAVVGDIEIKDLDKDTTLELSCELEGYNDEKTLKSEIDKEKKKEVIVRIPRFRLESGENYLALDINKDFRGRIPIQCIFPKNSIKLIDNRISKTVTLNVLFDYNVRSTFKVYTWDFNLEDQYYAYTVEEERLDPIKYFNKDNDPLYRGNGVFASEFTGGPIQLALGSNSQQPFSIRGQYTIGVNLRNRRASWGGEIKEIESLQLILPSGVHINKEFCEDFSINGILKGNVRKEATKKECTYKPGEAGSLAEEITEAVEKCLKTYNIDDIEFFCEIKVETVENMEEEDLTPVYIKADANYKYEVKSSKSVAIRRAKKDEASKDETEK